MYRTMTESWRNEEKHRNWESRRNEENCRNREGQKNWEDLPYFMTPEYAWFQEEQRETERELRRLQSMYPEQAKLLLPYIEEECDKMEYEGSPMFDEYPDRTMIYRLEERVCSQAQESFSGKAKESEEAPGTRDPESGEEAWTASGRKLWGDYEEEPETDFGRNLGKKLGKRAGMEGGIESGEGGWNWLHGLARVLLLNEMCYRRQRHAAVRAGARRQSMPGFPAGKV